MNLRGKKICKKEIKRRSMAPAMIGTLWLNSETRAICVRAAWRRMKCVFIFKCGISYFGSVFLFLSSVLFFPRIANDALGLCIKLLFIHSLMCIRVCAAPRHARPKHLQCDFSYIYFCSLHFFPFFFFKRSNEPTKNKTPIRIYS